MNLSLMKSVVRDNWYLFLLLAVIVAGVGYHFISGGSPEAAATTAARPRAVTNPFADNGARVDPNEAASVQPAPPRQTEQDKAREMIAQYQQDLDKDPKDQDAPAMLNAMANLSRQKLLDYKEAARYYGLILNDYPTWSGIARVYPQLATCYERLGDTKNEQWVYKEMMRKFPEQTQEYQFAKAQLGI